MFTGIIETVGTVCTLRQKDSNLDICIRSAISAELHADQSVSHNGVCLTVTRCENDMHFVTAIHETLQRCNMLTWKEGDRINLERSLRAGDRIDGHFVQGHVDTTAQLLSIKDADGSRELEFLLDARYKNLVVEKGSIAVNGVSLTVSSLARDHFSVALIPYTMEHTNLQNLGALDLVNIEFDILGKYVQRMLAMENV